MRAHEPQVRGGACRWDRPVSDEGGCARRSGGCRGGRTDPRYGVGGGWLDSEGLYQVKYQGHRGIWVPAQAASLKKRHLVCAHLEGAGHRGVDATMTPLEWHSVGEGMAGDVLEMTLGCECTIPMQRRGR